MAVSHNRNDAERNDGERADGESDDGELWLWIGEMPTRCAAL
jgi:hypothetical protein